MCQSRIAWKKPNYLYNIKVKIFKLPVCIIYMYYLLCFSQTCEF